MLSFVEKNILFLSVFSFVHSKFKLTLAFFISLKIQNNILKRKHSLFLLVQNINKRSVALIIFIRNVESIAVLYTQRRSFIKIYVAFIVSITNADNISAVYQNCKSFVKSNKYFKLPVLVKYICRLLCKKFLFGRQQKYMHRQIDRSIDRQIDRYIHTYIHTYTQTYIYMVFTTEGFLKQLQNVGLSGI